MVQVEYLLPFDTKDGICKNVASFNNLLSTNANIKIKSGKLIFKGSPYKYEIELSKVKNQNCSVFHIKLSTNKVSSRFREMLKILRKTLGPYLQDNIQTIWDGISFEWSKELYPLIYEVENSMRRLISKFMLVNLGIGWQKSAVPKYVEESIKTKDYKSSHSILYEVDFIQISNFFFKPYSIKDSNKLSQIITELLEKNSSIDEIKKQIQDYIPQNNWDRYFSQFVDADSKELKKKWEKLYDIRCKVSHNKMMNLTDYENAKSLIMELQETIDKAYSKISKIKISETEKENISLHSIATVSPTPVTSYYINEYLKLRDNISDYTNIGTSSILFESNNSIKSILDSSLAGNCEIPTTLHDNLLEIETYKDNILQGDYTGKAIGEEYLSGLFENTYDNIHSVFVKDPTILFPKNNYAHLIDSGSLDEENDEIKKGNKTNPKK